MCEIKNIKKLANILLDIGEKMMVVGSDISRVESTIEHIANSYDVDEVEPFVTTGIIVLTISKKEEIYTESRRIITKPNNNFEVLEQINELSRSVCENPISLNVLEQRVCEINKLKKKTGKTLFGYVITSFVFTIFFGGTYVDATIACICSFELYYLSVHMGKYCSNYAFYNFAIAFLNGLLIVCIYIFIPSANINVIMIGDIMLLIPGLSLTTAFQNTLIGDTTSGINQIIESLIWALAIAAGYGISIILTGVF